MKIFRALVALLTILAAGLPAPAPAMEVGVNTRHPAALNQDVAALMKLRNFKSARVDLLWDRDLEPLREQARLIRANGGNVQAVLQIAYQWSGLCNPDVAWVEQDAYRQAAQAVHKVKDLIHDFELLNENQLRPEILREVPWNSARDKTAPYEGKPCVTTLVHVLRGMARAIADIRTASRLPLRVIVGTVGRDWGFLKHLRNEGVQWDVTGFHVYPHFRTRSLLDDPWYGPGGPLTQLAAFGKPVHINEFNCGEIYDAGYENRPGDYATERCLRSLARHLKDLRGQKIAKLEAVHLYELLDEPHKARPENRFGLMRDLDRPKPHLYLAAAFAGGTLTPHERLELTTRGLLPDDGDTQSVWMRLLGVPDVR
jgi:hypothetical protein